MCGLIGCFGEVVEREVAGWVFVDGALPGGCGAVLACGGGLAADVRPVLEVELCRGGGGLV